MRAFRSGCGLLAMATAIACGGTSALAQETAGSNALRHKIDDVFDEPDWIADLLEDFDAGSDWIAIRHFV